MRRTLAVASALLALTGSLSGAAGDPSNTEVVRVGASAYTVRDVEVRLAALPPFQRRSFGSTPEEIRRRFVETVLVPELLLAEEAAARKVAERPGVADRLRLALSQALEGAEREALAASGRPTDADVRAWFEGNQSRFSAPERFRLARILLATEQEARELIASFGGTVTPPKWSAAAREKSLDQGSHLREGNLGFVRPDGQTDTPRVRVDPALYDAARRVKDGELVPEPVKEGERWAVVWRRGTLGAVQRTLEQEERSIRQLLARRQLEERLDALVARLRAERVKDFDPAPIELLQVTSTGDVAERSRPGLVPRRPAGSPRPELEESGHR